MCQWIVLLDVSVGSGVEVVLAVEVFFAQVGSSRVGKDGRSLRICWIDRATLLVGWMAPDTLKLQGIVVYVYTEECTEVPGSIPSRKYRTR